MWEQENTKSSNVELGREEQLPLIGDQPGRLRTVVSGDGLHKNKYHITIHLRCGVIFCNETFSEAALSGSHCFEFSGCKVYVELDWRARCRTKLHTII